MGVSWFSIFNIYFIQFSIFDLLSFTIEPLIAIPGRIVAPWQFVNVNPLFFLSKSFTSNSSSKDFIACEIADCDM